MIDSELVNNMGDSFEELYEKYNILSDAKDQISQVRKNVNLILNFKNFNMNQLWYLRQILKS